MLPSAAARGVTGARDPPRSPVTVAECQRVAPVGEEGRALLPSREITAVGPETSVVSEVTGCEIPLRLRGGGSAS
jgi:hypothetical protein